MARRRTWLALVLVAMMFGAAETRAGKGGNGGGKPGGGGGDPPTAPDPAIAYFQNGDLMVMNADGSNQTAILVEASSENGLVDCTWSPDGTRVAFRGSIQGDGLYVVGLDGTGLTKILDNDAQHFSFHFKWSPAATPDGNEKIAFNMVDVADGRNTNDVWLINPDGSGLQNLTDNTLRTEGRPTWAPDASRMAVSFIELAEVPGGGRVRTAAGLEVYDLTANSGGGLSIGATDTVLSNTSDPDSVSFRELDWARTSDTLVYTAIPEGSANRDLWTIDLTNPSSPIRITATPDFEESEPSWSPDDNRIVYRFRGYKKNAKQSGLYTIASDGTDPISLGAPEGEQPDWVR